MTTRDVQTHLAAPYKVEVSPELISKITDAVLPELRAWRSPAPRGHVPDPASGRDRVKVRTYGRVTNRPVYIAMAVDLDGCKHVLGLWLGNGDEGSNYWLGVLTEFRNWGVTDILIACDPTHRKRRSTAVHPPSPRRYERPTPGTAPALPRRGHR